MGEEERREVVERWKRRGIGEVERGKRRERGSVCGCAPAAFVHWASK